MRTRNNESKGSSRKENYLVARNNEKKKIDKGSNNHLCDGALDEPDEAMVPPHELFVDRKRTRRSVPGGIRWYT